jgi:hypothetical protein
MEMLYEYPLYSCRKSLWERLIQSIGGQQPYLNKDEWKHLQKQFDFSRIPTYLIFDNNLPGIRGMRKRCGGSGERCRGN